MQVQSPEVINSLSMYIVTKKVTRNHHAKTYLQYIPHKKIITKLLKQYLRSKTSLG